MRLIGIAMTIECTVLMLDFHLFPPYFVSKNCIVSAYPSKNIGISQRNKEII